MISFSTPLPVFNAIVVGAGGQGLRRAQALKLASGWRVTGLVDSNPAVLKSAGKRLACATSNSLDQMLDSQPCDVVVIATPPAFHDTAMAQAVHANKHILCEKPLTINPLKTRELLEQAATRNLVVTTGMNHRFYSPVMDALQLIQQGRIGPLQSIEARIGQKPPVEILNGWLGQVAVSGGGVLTDNGSHLLDLIRLFIGDLTEFQSAIGEFSEDFKGVETFFETDFTSLSGIPGRMTCSWKDPAGPYLTMVIHGAIGTIEISAFPWQLKLVQHDGITMKHRYLRDRIAMKLLGLKAPGLEMSLIREFRSFHNRLMGLRDHSNQPAVASAQDGLWVAECVDHLRGRINHDDLINSIISIDAHHKSQSQLTKSA